MPRKPPTVATNGLCTQHVPGGYETVLRKLCELRVGDAIGSGWLIASDDPEQLAKWEAEHESRLAALMDERRGQPLRVRSSQLPPNLPPPFENWPQGGGQRVYTIGVDDTITLLPIALLPRRDGGGR
jgi:hypothetical protein